MWVRLIRLSVPEGEGQPEMRQVWAREKWSRLPERPPEAPLLDREIWQDPEFPEELIVYERWESRQAYQTWFHLPGGQAAEQSWKQFLRKAGVVRQIETFEVIQTNDL